VDIHCVTRWSKLDTTWQGVSVETLLEDVPNGVSCAELSITSPPGEPRSDGEDARNLTNGRFEHRRVLPRIELSLERDLPSRRPLRPSRAQARTDSEASPCLAPRPNPDGRDAIAAFSSSARPLSPPRGLISGSRPFHSNLLPFGKVSQRRTDMTWWQMLFTTLFGGSALGSSDAHAGAAGWEERPNTDRGDWSRLRLVGVEAAGRTSS
jgi:hypothetical protein